VGRHPGQRAWPSAAGVNKGKTFSKEKFKALSAPYSFTELQKALLAAMLKEKGFEIE